jgi:hypothetical protein
MKKSLSTNLEENLELGLRMSKLGVKLHEVSQMIDVIEKMQPEKSAELWETMSKTSSNEELQKIIKEMVYGLNPEEHHIGPRDDVESNGESDAQSGEDSDSNDQSSKKKRGKKKKATNQHKFHVPKAWSLFLRPSGEFSQQGGKPMQSNLMTIGMINDFICHVYVCL